MNAQSKRRAEAVLQQLCIGAQISGIRFAVSFIILLDHLDAPHPINYDDIYLNVESRWTVYPSMPDPMPDNEDNIPERALDDRLSILARLHGQRITNVALGDICPHLIMTFESGSVFFLNGCHELYECWQLGLIGGDPNRTWLVVAVPGGEIAVWGSENIK